MAFLRLLGDGHRRCAGWVLELALLCVALGPAGCGSDDETGGGGTGGSGGTTTSGTAGGGGSGGSGGAAVFEPTVLFPKTALEPAELAILVNDQDPQSVAVGSYYQAARSIPASNVITLSFATGTVLSPEDFATVKSELDAALTDDIQALALTWTAPYRVGCMSVSAAFALGFDDKYCNTSGEICGVTAAVDYYDSGSARPFTDHAIRPAMVLAGVTEADVYALIDRGISADDTFPTGDGYFIRTTDSARSVRYPSFMGTVANWDYPGGLELTYIDNHDGSGSNVIENVDDVLFYLTGLANVPSIDTNTYLPGAVADHLTSFGGRLTDSSQMSIVRWLEAGATGSYGTALEPCAITQKFPETNVLLPHYFRGETLIEAYWKSVWWPGEGNFVGEPLARPWGAHTVEIVDDTLTIRTTMLDPAKVYELGGADLEAGPFTVVLGGLTVPHHELTTITLEGPGYPFIRLAEAGTP
ncbi:MAG: TIGR03790 family protein [Deltaproteobacteria bacterium]|nr:TIGR03790 family protein [Deltaproteobacteria bacterium]